MKGLLVRIPIRLSSRQWALAGLAVVVAIALVGLMSVYLPRAIDWHDYFRPATLKVLSGQSPYDVPGFPSPPWTLLPFLPLAPLPENVGRAIWALMSFSCFAIAAYRMGARPIGMAFFLLSPPVVHAMLDGNVDALVLLGFGLPPQVGLFFVTIKPQVGSVVALFWLVEAWRRHGARGVIRTFAPIGVAWLAAFAVYGVWVLRWSDEVPLRYNASLWPVSIPVGLALAVAAIRRRKIEFAMAAGPCLSPYVLLHAWSGALLSIVTQVPETIAAVAGLWILSILRAIG